MSVSLFETFAQIDPNVKFTDGFQVATAAWILTRADWNDPAEYALHVDHAGHLIVYLLDVRGCATLPPAYVEVKVPAPIVSLGANLQGTGFDLAMNSVV